jgi:hypothetical protein
LFSQIVTGGLVNVLSAANKKPAFTGFYLHFQILLLFVAFCWLFNNESENSRPNKVIDS